MHRLRFHAQTAAMLGLTGGGAWVVGCALVLVGAERVRRRPPRGAARPVLVLGCTPGPTFARRLDAAAGLYRDGLTGRVVVSGRGEAAWGAERLRAAGLPSDVLVEEPEARNTWENLSRSAPLLQGEGAPGPFYVVTDVWHAPRALLAAQAQGMDAWPVGVEGPFRARALAREGMSVVMSVSGGHVRPAAWLSAVLGVPAQD